MTKAKRTGSTGLMRGMQDAQRETFDQAQRATGQKSPTKAGRFYRKSYLMTPELIELVHQVAVDNRVGLNEFVRWALTYMAEGVRDGRIEIPTVEQQSRKIVS